MWQFEVFKNEDGSWRWRLVQCKTLIIAESSESFARRADAQQAAEAARAAIGSAPMVIL